MSKISELSDGGALQSTDYLIAVRSGGNVKVRPNGAVSGTTGQFSTSLNVDGTVTADGLTIYKSLNGDPVLGHFYNDNAGTAAEATVYVTNSSTASDGLFLQTTGTAFTTVGGFVQDSAVIGSGTGASGGLSIMTRANADMRFYTNGHTNERMRIDSNGNVGLGNGAYIGTLSSSHSLSIQGGAGAPGGKITLYGGTGSNRIDFLIGASEAARIDSSGNVGIGTTSTGGYKFDVAGTARADSLSFRSDGSAPSGDAAIFRPAAGSIALATNSTERMRIDSGGNVGIGTASPGRLVDLKNSADGACLRLRSDNAIDSYPTIGSVEFYSDDNSTNSSGIVGSIDVEGIGTWNGAANNAAMTFNLIQGLAGTTSPVEAMRIDSSGNLLVGKTSSNPNIQGVQAYSSGLLAISKDSGRPLYINRNTTDGELIDFVKDGSTVGSIGASSGDLYIGTGDTTLLFVDGVDLVIPTGSGGATRDAAISLGNASNRFKDLYLSGGVYLGGTGAANLLDDYEEGTWTPVVQGSGGGTYSYSTSGNYYTKIGRMVTLHFELLDITQVTAGSGYIQIAGAPFAKGSGHQTAGPVLLHNLDWFNSGTYGVVQFITSSATSILYVRICGDGSGGEDLQISALSSGVSDIQGSISYLV